MSASLGQAIRDLRERAGLSQYALARAAKIDQAIISRLESGTRQDARFEVACSIATALGISLDDLAVAAGLKKGSRSNQGPNAETAILRDQIVATRRLLQKALDQSAETLEKVDGKGQRRPRR